jgi:hypothetical protein
MYPVCTQMEANAQLEPRCGSTVGSKLRVRGGTAPQRVRSRLPGLPRGSVEGIPHNRDFGVHPIACASVCEPCFLHHAASGGVRGGGDADYAFKALLLKAEAKRCQGSFGGEAAAPP